MRYRSGDSFHDPSPPRPTPRHLSRHCAGNLLDYAIGGTLAVAGKKIVVIEKDDQGKPDIAVGPSSSGVALALLPAAEEYKNFR